MNPRITIIFCCVGILACLLIACGGGGDALDSNKEPCVYLPERDACAPSNENVKGDNV